MTESLKTLTDRANALKAERRFDEAIALYAKAAQTHPQSIAAEHNWAGALGDAGREGWIKFGEPGPVTSPELGYEHAVKPETAMLVLFPS